jgi:hypothetical protein
MSVQLFAPAALPRKKQPAVADISMLFNNSGCRVKTDRLVLSREINGVCCGNYGEQILLGVCNVVFSVKVWRTVSLMWTGTERVKGDRIVLYNCREQIVWFVW